MVLSAVLILFLTLVPDLFLVIPWPIRKAFGWVGFAGIVGFCGWRLVRVAPGDDRLPPEPAPFPRWLLPVLPAFCAALAVPLLRHPDYLGRGDWDLFLGKCEAMRRSILEWGQFPWWDPWTRGGFPLAANPQCSLVGVATPFILAFDSTIGLRLGVIVCYMLAADGARRLAYLWLAEPVAALAAGLIYAINGNILISTVAAYHAVMCYAALPWMLYFTFRLERHWLDGIWLGFWLAFNVLNGIQYFTVYIALIMGVVWLRALRVRSGADRLRFLLHSAVACGTFFALAGWRLATTAEVYRDFPRPYSTAWDESPWAILIQMINRPTRTLLIETSTTYFWETSWYVGSIGFVLALASLRWGWRWWHTLALICGSLAAGSVALYHPSYWLGQLPVFSTMHVVTRWRYLALMGIAFAAASTLARLRRSERRWVRVGAVALFLIIGLDYVSYGFQILDIGYDVPPTEDVYPGPPVVPIVQIESALGLAATQRGYGVIHGFEPLMGYNRRDPTARLWRGHADYVGESWTASGPVAPVFWSPNRITFQVEPNEQVFLNQNPGSWWLANGVRMFPDLRCAEMRKVFAVRADSAGRLDLRIRPTSWLLGVWLHVGGLVFTLVALIFARYLPAARMG